MELKRTEEEESKYHQNIMDEIWNSVGMFNYKCIFLYIIYVFSCLSFLVLLILGYLIYILNIF